MLRRLLKNPGFAVITLLTLAIGIGANTAIFSVINGILLKPLPFNDSERIAGLWLSAPGLKLPELNSSPSIYFMYREESQTLADPGIWTGDRVSVNGLAEPEQVDAIDMTPSVLRALDIKPHAGRLFSDKDGEPGQPKTVMLSYGYWMRHFGGDIAGTLGKRIRIDAEAYEVIGILPQSFRFLNENPMVLIPLQFDRAKVFVGNFSYRGIARLKPGVTWEQANADVARMLPRMLDKFPMPPGFSKKMFEEAKFTPNIRPLKREVVGDISTLLWILMGTIGMVLFIACANVANLLLVRAEGRQQELMIRAALGATRMDLAKNLLSESITLGLLGGLLGLVVAQGALQLLIAYAPAGLPRIAEIQMDPIVFVFAFAVSLLAGILFGLIPVYKYAGPRTSLTLRDGGRTASQGKERHRARAVLVIAQVALAMVLLVGSGLMIRTVMALSSVDPGFRNPDQVLTMVVAIPEAQVPKPERVLTMYQEMLRKIGEVAGVQSAALGGEITLDGSDSNDPIFAEDRTYAEGQLPELRKYKRPGPGLFSTLGNPLLAGRDFTWNDSINGLPVVILSENLARELWGDPARAIGKRVRESPGGVWREVVGVVGNEHHDGLHRPAPKIAHWPLLVRDMWGDKIQLRRYVKFAVRSPRTGSQSFVNDVRAAIWSVDSSIPIANVRTLREIQDRSMARTSFTLVMLSIAGGMALLLGIIGIYGVISYSVSQRTREIGIRTALGASSSQVRGMFVQHALRLAAIGVAIGLAASFALTRWMETLLYGVSPRDAVTLVLVPLILVSAALAASYLPARRATLVEPVEALRFE
jgi:predicted permease